MRASKANGPGSRAVIWMQGCSLNCPGCFNPDTHSPLPRHLLPVRSIVGWILSNQSEFDGITISGGEPLQQPEALLSLLIGVRSSTACSVVLFSGYTFEEMARIPHAQEIVENIDVLVAGRFVQARRLHGGLRGSANQTIHLLTDRYSLAQIEGSPSGEIVIGAGGSITVSGISPPNMKDIPEESRPNYGPSKETSRYELSSRPGDLSSFTLHAHLRGLP